MTPYQRQSGAAKAICQQRAEVYEAARQVNPTRCSRSTRRLRRTRRSVDQQATGRAQTGPGVTID